MRKIIAGLDIGTSSVKAALFDLEGHLLVCSDVVIPLHTPFPGWAEQDPQDWWSAACQSLKQVMAKIESKEVVSLGLSGQCPGHVMVDASGNAIGRAIIWRDQRAQEEARWLAGSISKEKAQSWVAEDFLGEATLPPARLLWLKRHAPENLEKCRVILQAKDFIGLKLTGVAATDINSAFCLYNPRTKKYEPDFFSALEVPISLMPRVLQPMDLLGKINQSSSLATGLPEGTAVVCGTIDAYCDNLAGGGIIPGCAVDVAGTSEAISLGINKPEQDDSSYVARIGLNGYFLCGPTQAGCDTLRWFGQGFYPEFGGLVNYAKLEQDAAEIPAGSEGLIFLPYLNGERAPIWDAQIRGGFIGLTLVHDRAHCTRAVYEGVGYAVRHILDVFEQIGDIKTTSITTCGGGSKSNFWNQIKADILQLPISVMEVSQTGCLGAAMLASVESGLFPDVMNANKKMMRFKTTCQPNLENASKYEDAYQQYRSLYPILKPLFRKPGE
jgi:xylulokinase